MVENWNIVQAKNYGFSFSSTQAISVFTIYLDICSLVYQQSRQKLNELMMQTCKMSISCSWGLWHETFSREVICFSFSPLVYLCPPTILQACRKIHMNWLKRIDCYIQRLQILSRAYLQWQIVHLLLISHLKTRQMRILNDISIHLLKVLNN